MMKLMMITMVLAFAGYADAAACTNNIKGQSSDGTNCAVCAIGKYNDVLIADKSVSTPCKDCASGKSTSGTGSKLSTDCANCGAGKSSGAGAACVACGDGKTNKADFTACENCAAGKAGTAGTCATCGTGKTNKADFTACENCAAGKAGTDGTCSACGNGKTNKADFTACENCAAGKAGTAGTCAACAAGKYNKADFTACEDVAGKCAGNKASATDLAEASTPAGSFQYACGVGNTLKANAITVPLSGADAAAKTAICCDVVAGKCAGNKATATDLATKASDGSFQYACGTGYTLKANAITVALAGSDAAAKTATCCDAVAGQCAGNKATATGLAEASTPAGSFQFACGTGSKLKANAVTIKLAGADAAAKKKTCCEAVAKKEEKKVAAPSPAGLDSGASATTMAVSTIALSAIAAIVAL